MDNCGLDITEDQFMKMSSKERDLIMFKNMIHIRGKLKNYSFHRKIQYVWLGLLTGFIGIKKFMGLD
jgi:hypothetical protein